MIYAGAGKSVNCAARTLKFDQLDVIYAGSGRSVNCAARTLKFDQLDVIYAGSGRSVSCAARTLKFDPIFICEDMPVVDNKYILLLIILFQVHGIPHSRYKSSVCFVYSIGPGLPGSCDYLRSLPVGLEFSCRGVRSILKNFPQD